MKKNIEIVPYNPNWPRFFKNESDYIKQFLDNNFLDIHHIGSTAVPSLQAKPIIDIILVVKNLFLTREQLKEKEYIFKGEYNIPMRYFFSKRGSVDLNIHVYEENHPEIELNLCFRDYLRTNKTARDEYTKLKEILLQDESSFNKENSNFTNYTLRKGDFIRSILKEVGFNRLRMLKCNDKTENMAAKNFRNQYFSGLYGVDDPYLQTFNHPDHVHLVLYKGCDIIGYAHLQFCQDNRADIKLLIIDKKFRNQNIGTQFLMIIEDWLISLGKKSVYKKIYQSLDFRVAIENDIIGW